MKVTVTLHRSYSGKEDMVKKAIEKLSQHNFTPTNVRVKYAIIDGECPPDGLIALKKISGVENVIPDDKIGR